MSESILDYLNGVARYIVEGNAKPSPPKDDQQQQQQESHPP